MNRLQEFALRRPSIIVGAVGAIVALAAFIGWPAQGFVIIHLSLAWLSLLLAALAMITVMAPATRVRAIIAIIIGAAGFVFWLGAPAWFGALPVVAYIATAAIHVGVGFLTPAQEAKSVRSIFIACVGAVTFIIVNAASALSA